MPSAAIAVLTVAALTATALPADAAAITSSGVSPSPPAPRTPVPQPSNTSAHSKPSAKPSTHSSRAATAPKQGAGESAAELDAAVKAYDTDTPVAVAGDTTDTTSVLANPDGTFAMTTSTTPVNALVNGSWVPVNTALAKNADGTYSPAAAAYPVTFSGGGTAPMVTIYDPASSTSLSIGWPTALPAPTVAGSTATYPNVLPGVDLRLKATSSGYSEVLVVNNAAAAADPGLGSLTFALQASAGLSLSTDASGSVTATDTATGRIVFAGEQPMMWDSATTGPIHTTPSADNPGSGTVTAIPANDSGITAPSGAAVKTKASASIHAAAGGGPALTVTLTPPAAALTGTTAAFPEFLDPNMTGGTQYYSEVMENGAPGSNSVGKSWHTGSGTSVGSGIVEVGYCGYSDCGDDWTGTYYLHYTTRTFYQLDTSPIQLRNGQEPNIYSATFNVQEIGNSDGCVKQPVALWSAGPITSGTNWGNQPVNGNGELSEASSNAGGGSGCGGANVALDAGSWAQAAANGNWPNATFLLRAPDEANEYEYKTFSDSANLYVVYNFAPLAPTNLAVSNPVNCTGTVYTADPEPTLYATGHDNNPAPLDLDLFFEVWNGAGTIRESWNTTGAPAPNSAANNANGSWTTNDGTSLPQGPNEFRVQAQNLVGSTGGNNLTGPWSAWYPFTEESVAPAQAPSIQSFDYPQGQWGQPENTPGHFTLSANGSANIAGYAYSFDTGASTEPVPSNTDCGYLPDGGLGNSIDSTLYGKSVPDYGNAKGELANNPVTGTAQIRIPHNMSPGRHTLYVKAFNDAHTPSTEASYTFYVAPDYSGAYLPAGAAVDVVYGDTLAAATPSGTVGTQVNNCCGATWDDGNQLFFSNTTNGASFTTSFNVPAGGTWELGLNMTVSYDYGQYRIDLDHAASGAGYGLDGTASSPFDGYNPSGSLHYIELGSPYLTAGTHYLTFTAVGKNAASSAYRLGIDYLAMSPTSRYSAAMLTTVNSGTSGAGLGIQVLSNLWADNEQQYLTSTAAGAAMKLTFNAPVESDYALSLDLTKASNYGQVSVTLDPGSTNHTFSYGVDASGNRITYLDGYAANVTTSHQFLGGIHLTQGSHSLRIAVTGANASSTGYSAGVAAIYAVPVTGAVASSFTAAMNNHGVASTDNAATTANVDGVGNELSGPQLAVAGLAPGNTLAVNGAVYTMPAYRTDSAGNSYDNVIADGQTIPIPAIPTGQSVSGIGLLLVSTCGSSWPGNLTVNYQSGQPSQPALPVIPDWVSGPASSSSLRLTYRDENSNATPNTAKPVGIWAVTVPTTAGLVPTSITLPITTNSEAFLPGSGACPVVMHVLAIGLETGSGSGPAAPTSTVGTTTYGTWDSAYTAPMDSAAALPTPSAGAASGITLTQVVTPSMIYPATTNYAYNGIRLHFTNNASASPVVLGSVTIAEQSSAGGANTTAAPVAVTFDANHYGTLTLTPGTSAWSNPIALPAGFTTGDSLVVSLYLPQTANTMPGWGTAAHHTNPALTTLVSSGNTTAAQTAPTGTASVTGAFYLDQADVTDSTQSDGTIAILGDQSLLTAPVAATATPATTAEPAWEINLENDVLNNSELQTQTTSTNGTSMPGAIANESQNCLVLGTTGTACPNGETAAQLVTDRVSQLPGLRDVIISLGANDVADGASATTVENELSSLIQQIGGISNPNTATGKVQAIITTIPNPGNNPTINAINSWIGLTPGSTSSQDNFHINVATAVGSDTAGSSQYYADWANAFTNGLAAVVPPSNQSFATHQ